MYISIILNGCFKINSLFILLYFSLFTFISFSP